MPAKHDLSGSYLQPEMLTLKFHKIISKTSEKAKNLNPLQ